MTITKTRGLKNRSMSPGLKRFGNYQFEPIPVRKLFEGEDRIRALERLGWLDKKIGDLEKEFDEITDSVVALKKQRKLINEQNGEYQELNEQIQVLYTAKDRIAEDLHPLKQERDDLEKMVHDEISLNIIRETREKLWQKKHDKQLSRLF